VTVHSLAGQLTGGRGIAAGGLEHEIRNRTGIFSTGAL